MRMAEILIQRVKTMYPILEGIHKPEDVKKLNFQQLSSLADEIRTFLIQTVSKTGGHLASNLGVVELTLALFKTLNLPQDAVIWDVGHQSYVHKLLTGRKNQFATLRRYGGLSGFPKSNESEYDAFNTGHSSTSVSAALGMTKAAELLNEDGRYVAVIGDGALTGGMALEALNNAGTYKKNFIVILNDNEMSIAQNVGSLSKHLTQLRTRPSYFRLKSDLERGFSRIPGVGMPTVRALKRTKDSIRHMIMANTIFEDLGFTYLGPIDGHDLPFLCNVLERAKNIQAPVLIHIITKKGKGYKFAEDKPTAFHGVGSFQVETGECGSSGVSYSQVFGKKLMQLAERNPRICAVTAAMPDGTELRPFAERYPKRFFDVGIAEQHAVTFAAGLAKKGLVPVLPLYSSFLQRAYDQVLHDVCLQNLHLVLCVDRAGLVGEDGETHQGLYDIAFLSNMPNMTVLAPANFTELEQMLDYALTVHNGPIAIRYPRGGQSTEYEHASPFSPMKADTVCRGTKIAILSAGNMLKTAMQVSELLQKNGYTPTVTNLRSVQPPDETYIQNLAGTHELLVTIEDGIRRGGVGEAIAAMFVGTPTRVLVKAHENGIVPQGARDILYRTCGLDAQTIADEILQNMKAGEQICKNRNC